MGYQVFEIDTQTPHPGVQVDSSGVAVRETNGGWVTLRSTKPLSQECHQWAVKILDHGEGNDGSGLMVGVLPRVPNGAVSGLGSKYISELGGWCLSRAGESYGPWKCDKIPFSTGSVLEFDMDFGCKTLYIVCGRDRAVAHLPSLSEEELLYPAFSMYYLNQRLMFV